MWTRKLWAQMRGRRMLETSVIVTTFCAALLTVSVSASTFLPCPVNNGPSRSALSEEKQIDREKLPVGGLGQRAHLTKQGGWIEIDERPSFFSLRRWTS